MLPNAQSSCAATCDATPENETAYSSSALVEESSAASKLVELQGKIELTMHRLDSTLREKEVLFDSKLQDKLFEFETVTNDDSCLQRVDELDCDLNRLSDLSAQKHAEMDAKLEDIRFECQSIAAKYAQQEQTVTAVGDTKSLSEVMLSREVVSELVEEKIQGLLMGAMQAAFTPMVAAFDDQMRELQEFFRYEVTNGPTPTPPTPPAPTPSAFEDD